MVDGGNGARRSGGVFYAIAVIMSLVCVFAALQLGVLTDRFIPGEDKVVNYRQIAPVMSAFFLLAMQASGAYQVGKRRLFEVAYGVLTSVIFVNIAMMALPFFDISYHASALTVLVTAGVQFFFLCVWATVFHRVYFTVFPKQPAVVVSDCVQDAEYCAGKVRVYSREFEITAVSDISGFGEVFPQCSTVIAYKLEAGRLAELGADCLAEGKQLCVVPGVLELGVHKSREFQFGDMMALRFHSLQMTREQAAAKRAFDIFLSVCALIVTGLPILIFAAVIFLQDRRSPFYKQERLTRGGRSFLIVKLRTMVWDAERDTGPVLAAKDDSRVTRLGGFLRRTRLDELPQFWNVLKGDMSVVGPRPERRHFTEEYSASVPQFKLRLSVKAGVTGMAHVYGRYDTPPDERIKLDLYYMLNYSLALDLKIIVETVRIMLSRSYSEGVKGKV
jgi:exopolysaccharide biosynthesis polyprenyl glycosylphosphotransferase